MNDLNFDYGWCKKIIILFQGKEESVKLVFSAYEGQDVLDVQKDAFNEFNSKQIEYGQKISVLISEYVTNYSIINPIITPETLLISRKGELSLLCDCSWDRENGIAIVLEPKCYITDQSELI